MTATALSDCIRSTPARTIGALALSAWLAARRAIHARQSRGDAGAASQA